jgi:TetR/AcrR family transcriptional regulator, transcriptional repressor for nem operon
MTTAPGRKEESRERIVRAAARAIRKHGYERLGVAQVMKDAGLTHGGFYAHFQSRDALLAEAADRAGAESVENLSKAVRDAKPGTELIALIDAYLSDRHVAAIDQGCAIAASGSEVPRQSPEVRRAATRGIKDLIGLVERQMSDWGKPGSRDRAMAILGCLVGTLLIARSVDDPELSRAMRKAARAFIRDAAG